MHNVYSIRQKYAKSVAFYQKPEVSLKLIYRNIAFIGGAATSAKLEYFKSRNFEKLFKILDIIINC